MGKRKALDGSSMLQEKSSDDEISDAKSKDASEEPIEEPSEEPPCEEPLDSDGAYSGHSSESVETNSTEKRGVLEEVWSQNKYKKVRRTLETKPNATIDLQNKSRLSKTLVYDANTSEEGEEKKGSSGKRQRSDSDGEGDGGTSKRRRNRWAGDEFQLKMLGPIQLPDFVKEDPVLVADDVNREIRELNFRLLQINRKLQGSEVVDDRAEEDRSPSPPPVYDNLGIRINSRGVRLREKLILERQQILSMLTQKNPTFKRPSEYKPVKLYKKLYLPLREYPGYNFVGLIIGPRGNTLKRMEKESGARIVIRGKGSVKEGKPQKRDPSDNEDLHVLVEAGTHKSLDAAAKMVERLLVPVDEENNEHKHAQLKELAELNGTTTRDESICRLCGEQGHKQYTCPNKNSSTFKIDTSSGCPLTALASGPIMDSQYHSFLADVGSGGGRPPFSALPPVPSSGGPWEVVNGGALRTLPSYYGSYSWSGLGSTMATTESQQHDKDIIADTNLYVGYLPQCVDDDWLTEMFSPYGRLIHAKVIRDRTTGMSKGYGFVKYSDPVNASTAVKCMNGHKIEGKSLVVRLAGFPPVAPLNSGSVGPTPISLLPKYTGSASVPQEGPRQSTWPGPPGPTLQEPYNPFPKSEALDLPPSSCFWQSDCFGRLLPSYHQSSYWVPISSSSPFPQFRGNLKSFTSPQYRSYYTTTTCGQTPSKVHLSSSLGSSGKTHLPWAASVGQNAKVVKSEYVKFMSEMAW
ncbi:splicing factor-like protein 1 [Tasmannia lanceolata]|uniref:splicing factor-like protein 1 n=1 Tax=Tasmannia lanceolata TaxID=3420 RepID=UPI004062FE98